MGMTGCSMATTRGAKFGGNQVLSLRRCVRAGWCEVGQIQLRQAAVAQLSAVRAVAAPERRRVDSGGRTPDLALPHGLVRDQAERHYQRADRQRSQDHEPPQCGTLIAP